MIVEDEVVVVVEEPVLKPRAREVALRVHGMDVAVDAIAIRPARLKLLRIVFRVVETAALLVDLVRLEDRLNDVRIDSGVHRRDADEIADIQTRSVRVPLREKCAVFALQLVLRIVGDRLCANGKERLARVELHHRHVAIQRAAEILRVQTATEGKYEKKHSGSIHRTLLSWAREESMRCGKPELYRNAKPTLRPQIVAGISARYSLQIILMIILGCPEV